MDCTLTDLGIKLDRVINIDVPVGELVNRMTGRRICKGCGATFHVTFNPSTKGIQCDKCDGELYQRADDTVETVTKRLTVYSDQTKPLIEYYQGKGLYSEIDGRQLIEKVFSDIVTSLRGE